MVKLLLMPFGTRGIFQTLNFCSHRYGFHQIQNQGELNVFTSNQRIKRRFARKANPGCIQSTIKITQGTYHHRSGEQDQHQRSPRSKGPNPRSLKGGQKEKVHHLKRANARQGHEDLQHHLPRSSKSFLYDLEGIDPKETDGWRSKSFKTACKSFGVHHE